ncbi:Tetratricopeptide repeat protein 4 homolog [Linum perenne]
MALLMEKGSEPTTESEIIDLDAIAALKQSSAIELKEQGNQYVKMGKKHYSDAIDCYTRAINQKALSDLETSLLYSNRAHVNLLLGNYRRALTDAEEAIKLFPSNVKAFYRAAKASLSLNLLSEAKSFSEKGLELDSSNVELDKLVRQISDLKVQQDKREAEANNAVAEAKELLAAFDNRGLKMGIAMYRELVGLRKPLLDKNKLLHWPVLLLYAEAGSGVCLPKTKVLKYLLEGTAGANLESEKDEKDTTENISRGKAISKWVKVNEKRKLIDVMKEPDFIIPGIPVFYVVSKRSSFYEKFRSGKWKLP